MDFKPLYYGDKINVINPRGHAGIVTRWFPPAEYRKRLQEGYPALFESGSPLVAVTSLYGNGLPQMLANLANNPQVERIAVTGTELSEVLSGQALMRFFSDGVEPMEVGGVKLARIKGTTYSLDPQLRPEIFNKRLKIREFETKDLEGLVSFVSESAEGTYSEGDRRPVELATPKFSDYPSNLFGHNIYAERISEAWMDVMHALDRFGKPVTIGKGSRRALFDVDVHIKDPSFESDDLLQKLNFDPAKLRAYQESILNPDKGTQPYTYGHRFRTYFGKDLVNEMVRLFKEDPVNRHSFITTWDNTTDTVGESSAPCLTDVYFANVQDQLALTASFRTHNAVAAWMDNAYGLSGLQHHVAREIGMPVGSLNIRSRWLGIDPANGNTIAALQTVKQYRKKRMDANDPQGYFVIEPRGDLIVATHYTPAGLMLDEYTGSNAKAVKDQLRQASAISDSDHAMWIGHQLASAELKLHGKVSDLS